MQGYLDVEGVARRLGVKPTTVHIYTYRARLRRSAQDYDPEREVLMPEPVSRVGNSPIWDEAEIGDWMAKRRRRRT